MKVLTPEEMREVDHRTIEAGIPGIVLMENAGMRVVEFLAERFAPLREQRVVILCGKGNNGGDGMVVARQLFCGVGLRPAQCGRRAGGAPHVVLLADPAELKGDAAANYGMLLACGCPVHREIPPEARNATLVIDALFGTGITGAPTGRMSDAIREINTGFPLAKVVAVDIPSGLGGGGEVARADYTVTFTAPKVAQVIPPGCDQVGELIVGAIGSPPALYDHAKLEVIQPAMFARVLAPRPRSGHKGTFGHVLVVAGSQGKTGAAAMAGLAALRAGAGLVTVASSAEIAHAPELMTAVLPENGWGSLLDGKTVVAMGPGLGRNPQSLADQCTLPLVLDADALPAPAADPDVPHDPETSRDRKGAVPRILTPHPGEMSRLTGKPTAEIQADRIAAARDYATSHRLTLALKGQRTVIAFPDGRVWINPTGTPALGTGGSGDILTGLIAGLLAQFPDHPDEALAAAVYLHGLAGEIGARAIGEKCLIATDILRWVPDALEECARLPHRL
jgi:NAD(P)H-hydrate epimerase